MTKERKANHNYSQFDCSATV